MWWRLAVLTGLFFGVSRIWTNEAPVFRGTAIVYHNPVNGHYYQWIQRSGIDWQAALDQAARCRFAGQAGHLATITSQDEQRFLGQTMRLGNGLWIAASDAEQEGTWKWVAGEEAGETFFVIGEGPVEDKFSNWVDNEPNNYHDDEDYAVVGWMNEAKWNDLSATSNQAQGYLVEYAGLPHPEKLILTTGNTFSPQFGSERPTIVGEKDGNSWRW